MFAWRADQPGLTRAVTDRWGGVSHAPYAELNLGPHVADDPEHVAGNRGALAAALGLPVTGLAFMRQVHGSTVAEVRAAAAGPEPEADALVTRERDVALAVMVADCVPVLLDDGDVGRDAGVIAVAHIGRPGLARGLVGEVVTAMRDLGSGPLRAVVGPAICGACYEVPQAMQREVLRIAPDAAAVSHTGTAALDIGRGAAGRLRALGVAVAEVRRCTRETPDFFSYRRDGRTGRFAGVIVRRSR